jgi:hypothetical protein
MSRLFYPTLLVLLGFSLKARNPVDTSFYYRGESYYVIIPSYQYTSAIVLNTILKQQGAPTISRSNFMAGLGFEDRWKWFNVGVDFVYGINEHSNDKYYVYSPTLVSNIWLKYYVFKNKQKGGIYPFGGIAAINQHAFITDKNSSGNINQLFTQPGAVNMGLSTGFAQFGVGADAINFTKEDDVYFSFKMGYRLNIGSTSDNQWYINDQANIVGSPTEKLNAFFIQLAIGYTSNRKSNKQLRTN